MQNDSLSLIFSSAPPMTAQATPSNVTGYSSGRGSATVVTNSTTITPIGGAAPYTYAWSIDTQTIAINSPTMATTTFRASLNNSEVSGTATCVVQDATGKTATVTVGVDIERDSGNPSGNQLA